MNRSNKEANNVFKKLNSGETVEQAHQSRARGNNVNAGKKSASTLDSFKLDDLSNAITLIDDNTFSFGKFTLTPKGFELPEDVTVEDMDELAIRLFALEGSIQWLIGDWLVYGDGHEWGELERVANDFSKDVSTLYDYKKIAKAVDFRVRTPNLTFSHHKVIAFESKEDHPYWIKQAVDNKWTVSELRQAIKDSKPSKEAEKTKLPESVVKAAGAVIGLYEAAATKKARKQIRRHLLDGFREVDDAEKE